MDPHWIVKWGANQWEVFEDREDAVEMATHNRGQVFDISQVPSFEWLDPRCPAKRFGEQCTNDNVWPDGTIIGNHPGDHVAWRSTSHGLEYVVWNTKTTIARVITAVDYESIRVALEAEAKRETPF